MVERIIYAHEHITIDLSGVKNDIDCRLDDRELADNEFAKLRAANVCGVVDQTCRGMGRNPLYAQSVADKAGIEIYHATGFYKEPFLPEECYKLTENEIRDIFLGEIENGMDDTGIKASFIGEIGTSGDYIHPIEEKIFIAATKAHGESGVSVCTHTTLGKLGLEQLEIFKKYNVDLSKVVLSHIDLSGNMDYMLRLLDTGVNIAFDTIGKNNYQPDLLRAKWLNELCERGHVGQIVASMDITRRSNCVELGYNYLLDVFVKHLYKEYNFKAKWLDEILYTNPSRIYGIGRKG